MTSEEITRIRVSGREVGIVGLETALDQAVEGLSDEPEEHVKEWLLRALSARNYIPAAVRDDYGEAFFRAFRRRMGEPLGEDPAGGCIRIRVLGAGCSQCTGLYQELIETIASLEIDADVEHVTDVREIARYGILGTPALVVNGEIKCAGRVPSRKRIEGWLREASSVRPCLGRGTADA
ncbi:MAG: thioredoxin family protein [Deltaproteobacteria bacterium]|nr:thioredoxin family protein [Deltaproteobacteria bacterium]